MPQQTLCMVCFFGTVFTIMAYHNDVGIRDVFAEVDKIVTKREPQGINEISYSIGLAAGKLFEGLFYVWEDMYNVMQ